MGRWSALTATLALCVSCARPTPRPAQQREVSLWFIGDVHPGRSLDRLFTGSAPLVAGLSREVGFVNLEGPLVRGAEVASEARLVNDPRTLPALYSAGVRVASIANNHAMDNGADGVRSTSAALALAGITAVGERAEPVVVTDRSGVRVAWVALDLSRGVAANTRALFARARALAPVRVVSLHVSAPALYTPAPAELRVAVRDAVAEEATIVVAHGTHTIAPITREGRTLVAWGLGNAIFNCECSRETEGLLLRVTVRETGETQASIVALEAGLDGRPATFNGPEGASLSLVRALGVRVREQGETAVLE